MWKNTVWGEGACANPVGLFMYESPMETVEYIWANIWCMLDWISSQKCKNTLPLHTVDQLVRIAKNETAISVQTGDQTQTRWTNDPLWGIRLRILTGFLRHLMEKEFRCKHKNTLFLYEKRMKLKVSITPISGLWKKFRMSLGHEFIWKMQGHQGTQC